jgi:CheY-like chemotaxis protein
LLRQIDRVAGSRRILVAESSADAGEALCELLAVWGHEAAFVDTGQRAVQRAIREHPDVVILDLGLADLDGCKVAALIRSTRTGHVPVVLAYSGYHQREAEALKAGCDAFILKPAIEELESLILGTREQARQYAKDAGPAGRRRH